jgi:hypothetical protein
VQGAGCRVQGAGCRVQGRARLGIYKNEFRYHMCTCVPASTPFLSSSVVKNLGFRVFSMVFHALCDGICVVLRAASCKHGM